MKRYAGAQNRHRQKWKRSAQKSSRIQQSARATRGAHDSSLIIRSRTCAPGFTRTGVAFLNNCKGLP
jgi:hypothetical protein